MEKRNGGAIEKTEKKISDLGGRFGQIIEYMVAPSTLGKFAKLGFKFTKIHQDTTLKDENYEFLTQIDITLEDGDKVLLVEVKSKPDIDDIKEHVERVEKVRSYVDKRGDKRKYLGAIAGMIFNENERNFALKNGFYVVESSGETFKITEPKAPYTPREW